jgi:hypothetical protein
MPVSFARLAVFAALAGASLALAQSIDKLELHKVRAETAAYQGRQAVHLVQTAGAGGEDTMAIVAGPSFRDGKIEVDVAGAPAPGSMEAARGFIGIAFRVQPEAAKFELLYLRPTNGRADDQLRRNHSTQYVSVPDWPWQRTRKETPGLYESYVDLESGVWTKVRIEVSGTKARLFVGDAGQPCLVVNDLKLGVSQGAIALWVGPGTDGYFANLRVTGKE